jgi:5-methylcytosine-specific restriction endonuclease McrA
MPGPNDGKWTEGRYQSFVRSVIRGGFRRWPPKWDALKDAYAGTKNSKSGRKAKHYKCAKCRKLFTQTSIQIDHIEAIGPCKTWDEFIKRLFCEKDNLQALCKACHKKKTAAERKKCTTTSLKVEK